MAYSKSPRPYRRYSVRMPDGRWHIDVRAHNAEHARELAWKRHLRHSGGLQPLRKTINAAEVYEGTVRRATS